MTIYDGEIWKQYKETPYYASSCGRVKRIYNNGKEKILSPWIKKSRSRSSYMAIKIHCKETVLAQVVYETFNGPIPEGYVVVHRNKVFTDNALVNLKLADRRSLGSLYGGRTAVRRLIYCHDNKCIYKGTREASKALHISRQTVSNYCNNKIKKPIYRLRWMSKNE